MGEVPELSGTGKGETMTKSLYPHEIVSAWIDRHILGISIVVTIVTVYILGNALFDFLFRDQFGMYPYGCCEIGPRP